MPETLPLRLEAGTQNAAGIAGLLAGVRFVLEQGVGRIREHELALTAILLDALRDVPGLVMLGPADLGRRTAVVSMVVEGYVPDQLAVVLDQVFDVATRADCTVRPRPIVSRGPWRPALCASAPAFSTRRTKCTSRPRRYEPSWADSVAKERIEKTLLILEEDEVRQVLAIARREDPAEIAAFVTQVVIKKVEAALRQRCG